MDLQETVESLRKVIEGALAPSIRDMQMRLDGVEKGLDELHEEIRDVRGEMRDGMADLRGEMREMNGRMETRFDTLNGRLDTVIAALLSARQPTYPDAILTRLEQVEKVLAELRK